MDLVIIGLCGQSVFLSVDHFHRPEETLHAHDLFAEPGGKGYNQAVAAARMGASVAFAGAVGPDADGETCAKRLEEEGIVPLMAVKDGRTAFAAILTDRCGENRVTVYAGVQLSAQDIDALEAQIASAKLLLLTPEIPEPAFARAMELAARHSVRVVINPAPYVRWVEPYLADAWCLTPNRSEACAMLGCREEELEARLACAPHPRMLVTLGGEGALCVQEGTMVKIPARPVVPVDTTGAGDCLNGALCARLLAGDTLLEAAKKAVLAASLSVTRAHVLDAMPLAEEMLSD